MQLVLTTIFGMVHPSTFERLYHPKDKFDAVIRNPYSIILTTSSYNQYIKFIRTTITYQAKDSQKIKIKKKTKTPRITDEGWNSQKRLSDPVEKKMKEGKRRKKRLLYLHLKLSLGLVPLGSFYRIGI